MAGLKYAFLLFMIIIIRIFVVFVDDTSSSLQTFKEILAFFGKWFASILLEPFQGIFLKLMFLSFFFWASNNYKIYLLHLPSLILKEIKIGSSRKCNLSIDWALCKKTNHREGGGGGNMLLPVFSAPTFCPTFCNSQQHLHRLGVTIFLPKSYSPQVKKLK